MGGRKCNIPLLTEQKTRRVNGGKTVKKLIALLLAMILSISMFSGCSSKEETGEQQQTAEQSTSTEGNMVSADCKGSVLTWNLGVDSQTLDPAKAVSDDSMSVINNTFEGLMRESANGVEPAMAQDMPQETENEDGTVTLTYTLRDASWSDGQPVTANDFEFAWKRCADPANNAENAYLMGYLANYDDIAQGLAEVDTLGVKAVDDKTLEVTLKQPTEYFNELLTLPAFMPLREDMVGSDDSWSKDPQRAVSNGPFTLAGYTAGTEFVLQKNDQYWNKENVSLDYIVARMLDENFAPVGMAFGDIMLTEGEVSQPENQTDTEGNTVEVPQLANTVTAATIPSSTVVSLVVNTNTANSLLKNADVRNALSLALDRTAAAEAAGGQALLSVSPLGGENLSATADTEKALSMINGAGSEEATDTEEQTADDKSIEIVYLENDELAAALETVKSSWEALGFSVTLTAQDAETFKLSRNSLQYADILCSVWEADAQDQQLYLEPYLSYNVQSGCGYTNPDFDQLMLDAMQASGEERTAKLSEAETTLLEDGYVMPLYQQTITTTSDTAKVSGWSILPNGMYWFGEASINK